MLPPHGGTLIDRTVTAADRAAFLEVFQEGGSSSIEIDLDTVREIENIAHGLYSPLTGFLTHEELEHVLTHGRLPNDLPWTMPIIFPVDPGAVGVRDLKQLVGKKVFLTYGRNPVAVLEVVEAFKIHKLSLARRLYGTEDPHHPGVTKTMAMGDWSLAGPIRLLAEVPGPFSNWRLHPAETRVLFQKKGWRTVVAFQTRNAPHLGHEYVQKTALTFVDGLLINPVLGKKKPGDFSDEAILAGYKVLLETYFLKENAVLAALEYEMRYAGPKEAIHHAIMRKNLGCTHFVVGRDHAGVGKFYGPYDAQKYFDEFPDLGIVPLPFREFFYCKRCDAVTNSRVCPHGNEDHLDFSGTKIRELFLRRNGELEKMMRPEVVEAISAVGQAFVV
ncbi:MAG: sulfate adenylyltransferase [Candidatus Methanomethyliaceae archaeon]